MNNAAATADLAPATRAAYFGILSVVRVSEQTEEHVFAALRHIDREIVDEAIGLLLDGGRIASTIIDGGVEMDRKVGRRFFPALRAV